MGIIKGRDMIKKKKKCVNCKYWNRISWGDGKCLYESFDINSGDTSVGFLAIMKRNWGRDCSHFD